MLEHKTLALHEAKALDEAPGSFEGYASMFDTEPDSYGDVIDPGAYKDTLAAFLADGFIAWGHDWANPIATPTTAREDDRGLFLSATYHTHDAAQRARTIAAERIARGKSMGLSIGYEALAYEERKVETPYQNSFGEFTDKVRALTKIKLYEVSLVTVPAQASAQVMGAKSNQPFRDQVQRVLADLEAAAVRAQSITDLRAKSGRELSEANRSYLSESADMAESLAGRLREMVARTEPSPKSVDLARLRFEFDRRTAAFSRQYGVSA